MNDLNKDLSKKLLNYLEKKQFERLQFDVEMLGNIDDQHPLIIFYYAASIYFKETSTQKELLRSSALFEKVYLLNKKNLQALYNMIAVSFKTKVFKDVLNLTLEAFEENNNDNKLLEGLARINFYLGNKRKCIELFRKLYKNLPDKMEGRLPFISSINYTSGIFQEDYLQECLNYASLIEKNLDIENDSYKFDNYKNDKIKVAFLSADFKTHPVSQFIKDLLIKMSKNSFDVHLISNLRPEDYDQMSYEFKKIANKWHDIQKYSDTQAVEYLRSLKIDVLIDLSGFTQGNRLELIAKRCARIQIEWLGYNNSLGLKNLDYLISDRNLIKNNELNLYSEKILFMPKIWNALTPPNHLPEIDSSLKNKGSTFSFCSFNNFQKLSDSTINVWSKILNQTNSQIYLKNSLYGGEDLKENVMKKFYDNGVKKKQLIFLDKEKKLEDHLKLYNKADLALDTFPYPGVTTTYEALLMGLPVLTMKGFNFNSRCGESIMKNMNMQEMIANDEIDYFNKAISIVNDKNSIKKNLINLRERTLSSPLFDTDTFANDFCNLIKHVHDNA